MRVKFMKPMIVKNVLLSFFHFERFDQFFWLKITGEFMFQTYGQISQKSTKKKIKGPSDKEIEEITWVVNS